MKLNTKNVWRVLAVLAVLVFTLNYVSGNISPWVSNQENPAQVVSAATQAKVVPGQYIVELRSDTKNPSALATQLVLDNKGELKSVYTKAVVGFAAKLSEQALVALERNPNIVRIEPDHLVSLDAKPSTPSITWGIDRVDQRSLPLNNSYTYNSTGEGVNVYVIDSGIRFSHVEFGGRAVAAFSLVNDGNGANDCHGHGTHVAGTIGGVTVGVAKKVTLHAVRIFNCNGDSIPESTLLSALDWVTQNKISPAVINLSLGAIADNSIVNTAVENVVSSGIVVVVSAGNAAADACLYTPAAAPSAITVAASTRYDQGAGFSNYGPCVDIYAPGSGIDSAWATTDSSYASMSGTSMATPHVSGVAALYLSQNPSSTPVEVTNAIMSNASLGKMTYISPDSPNFLLYSLLGSATPPPPTSFGIIDYGVSAITTTTAAATWTTNEPSTGYIVYNSLIKGKAGPAITLYDNISSTSHAINLHSLLIGTNYNYTLHTSNGSVADTVTGSFKTQSR